MSILVAHGFLLPDISVARSHQARAQRELVALNAQPIVTASQNLQHTAPVEPPVYRQDVDPGQMCEYQGLLCPFRRQLFA